jgi:hypothetical protein
MANRKEATAHNGYFVSSMNEDIWIGTADKQINYHAQLIDIST